MGLFKSLFGGNNTPETEKEKNDKKNFEILKYDGIRAQRMGKLPYAIKCFEEAVAINDELETLSLLATAYTQANRLDDARITLDRMATKDPEQVNTFLSLAGICYMQEDYENMKDACQKALVLDNKNPLSFYLTAKAAIGMKDDITAIAMLTKAIVLKEDYTEAYQLRAEVLWKMKQAKDAANYYDSILNHLCSFCLLQIADILTQIRHEVPDYARRPTDIFRLFKKTLMENYRQHHDIGFYAESLHISTTYLSRIVKHITGHTVRFHISELLCADARKLLECTDLDIKEIAEKLGFSDQSVFGKFFVKKTGVSPMKFRTQRERDKKNYPSPDA